MFYAVVDIKNYCIYNSIEIQTIDKGNFMIELYDITKSFKNKKVLNGVNLTLEYGKIYGITGLLGSGKSTLLKIMLGLIEPDSGEIWIDHQQLGEDIKIVPDVGALIEKPTFFEDMSGIDNLRELAAFKKKIGEKEIVECLDRLGFTEKDRRSAVKSYTPGMRQKLGLAQAFMEHPKIIILDEPTEHLELDVIEVFHKMIFERKKEGALILIVSHNRYEIFKLCDEIYEMRDGECYERKKIY